MPLPDPNSAIMGLADYVVRTEKIVQHARFIATSLRLEQNQHKTIKDFNEVLGPYLSEILESTK